MKRNKKVFVGLSGGVDSSVAALRLLSAHYEVVGVFIKVWQPDFLTCNWETERLDAMRVAAHLGIPFITFDGVEAYKKSVADYLISEYSAGRTPNPDVMCNEYVKFGAFYNFARNEGADFVATGHYARVHAYQGRYELLRGIDTEKDQSYFLWTLREEQLAHILFPIGDTVKIEVRREAQRAGLPTFAKRDSQGICFLGQVDMKEFLSHYIEEHEGDVLSEQGEVIGTHRGALFFTLGERHGFTLYTRTQSEKPLYVTSKDTVRNTITVSSEPKKIADTTVALERTLFRNEIVVGHTYDAQFRYRQQPFAVVCTAQHKTYATLSVVEKSVAVPSPGQSCVLYQGEVCCGGGIIS